MGDLSELLSKFGFDFDLDVELKNSLDQWQDQDIDTKAKQSSDIDQDNDNIGKVDYSPTQLAHNDASASSNIATPSAGQVAAGLTGEGVGQWRRYREQMAGVLPVVQPWVERFGYPAG